MDRLLRPADFALDFAAPVESAGAPFDHLLDLRLVTPSATHEVASVHTDRRLVTHTSLRTSNAKFEVLFAKVWRILVVDEILLGWRLVLGIVRLQLVVVLFASVAWCPARVADEDARRSVETVFQIVTDDAEERQTHPTSAHRARAAHSVAFAFLPHLGRNVLQNNNKRCFYYYMQIIVKKNKQQTTKNAFPNFVFF